jgi:integrase
VPLTDVRIRTLKAPARDRWISDGEKLYLRVRRSGFRTWVLRRRKQDGGNVRLGTWPTMGLKAARAKAGEFTGNRIAEDLTLRALLDEWHSTIVAGKHRRAAKVLAYFDRIEPTLLASKLLDLDRMNVRLFLRRYAVERGPIGANRLLAILKTALKFAVNAGYLNASPLAELTKALVGGTEAPRDRVLTDEEIRAIWNTDSPHVPLLRFLLLTGQRIGEAQRATWAEIKGDRWLIPREHMKNQKPHWCALSRQTRKLLRELKSDRALVFGHFTTTGTQDWLRRWCEREEISPAFRPHDLRRTFATRLNELGVAPHVVEKILSHTLSGVMKVYNHAEHEAERVKAMQAWADALDKIIKARR